jgi:hypothetical protein
MSKILTIVIAAPFVALFVFIAVSGKIPGDLCCLYSIVGAFAILWILLWYRVGRRGAERDIVRRDDTQSEKRP